MTWLDNSDTSTGVFLSPSVSAFPQMSGFPGDDGPERDGWVQCDAPDCDEFWGIHGTGDFDAYLRSQGWASVVSTYGMRHLCLEHA
jgi:hypothetical protein